MDKYIVITQEFADSLNGKVSEVTSNILFGFATTTDGRVVTSINSAVDFPIEFDAIKPHEIIELSYADFPPTPPIE